MKITKENTEFSEMLRISDEYYSYNAGYYSDNTWLDENRIILARFKNAETYTKTGVELVLVNLLDGSEKLLVERCNDVTDFVVNAQNLYYINGDTLFCKELKNGTERVVCRFEGMKHPHITNDGRYINWCAFSEDEEIAGCYITDLTDGSITKEFVKHFAPPFTEADHFMICPTDRNKIFFCHEGNTFYVSNRLWMYEKNKGIHCIAKQNLTEDGDLGDCFGHECWTSDGKGLYFVKYKCSPTPPRGICYVDAEGNQTDVLYGKYNYWHVCVSPNGRFLASDTQDDKYSGVCIIDTKTGEEKMLYKANTDWIQLSHPHPAFTPSSEKLYFHELKDGKVSICVMKII